MGTDPVIMKDSVLSHFNDAELLETALQNIIEHVPAHIYWKDIDGKYLGCNNAQANSLGFSSSSDVVGKTDLELPWPDGLAQEFRNNDLEVMKTAITKTTEEKSIMAGKDVIVLSQKVPLKNKQNNVIGILGISFDVTDRKEKEQLAIENQAHNAAAEQQKKFQKFVEQLLNVVNGYKISSLNDKIGKTQLDTLTSDIELTKREREVLYYLALNRSPKEIAQILSILENKLVNSKAVQAVIDKQLYPKFGVYSISQIVEKAYKYKLIPFLLD